MITMAEWKPTLYHYWNIFKVLFSRRLTYGKYTKELEERFAEIHGRRHALFTSSGTSALKIGLRALKHKYGWKDGDEVIIPAVTFVATMNVVMDVGLKPVFVDVDLKNINIDPFKIEKAITDKTVAIMPVHLLGSCADMTLINRVAHQYKLKVIEDSCETVFIRDKDGWPVGSRGDVACFSSYIAHVMVTGVGGFITTNDDELADYMRSLRFHGRDNAYLSIDDNDKDPKEIIGKRFLFDKQGYSDRLTELEAVLGLGDLNRYEWIIRKRQKLAKRLREKLRGCAGFLPIESHINHAFMFFPLMVDNRDKVALELERAGIQTRLMMPLTNQPIVKELFGDIEDDFPNAQKINRHGLLMGCHQYMTNKDIDYIAKTIKELL